MINLERNEPNKKEKTRFSGIDKLSQKLASLETDPKPEKERNGRAGFNALKGFRIMALRKYAVGQQISPGEMREIFDSEPEDLPEVLNFAEKNYKLKFEKVGQNFEITKLPGTK